MLFSVNLDVSIPTWSFSIYIFITPFVSITPYLLSLLATYSPASLSISVRLSYIICTLVCPDFDNTPTFLSVSTKKSPIFGKYVILSYFASNKVFPSVSITPYWSLFPSFITTNILSNIAF